MYALKITALITLVFLAPSAIKEVIFDRLVERQAIFFEADAPDPYSGRSLEFHENGRLAPEGYFKSGKRDGFWSYFEEDGHLANQGVFRDGNKDGWWDGFDSIREIRQSTY